MIDKKSILIVDDEEMCRHDLSMILIKCGYDVDTAHDGNEALESFKKKQYDLLITDKMMPDINGIDLLKRVNTIAPETDVIMITGYGDVETYLESMTLGASEYLNKPINVSEFKKAVSKVFSKYKNYKLAEH